jgi:folate-binding protein YgfZ
MSTEIIANQNGWDKLRVTGEDRVRFVQGMLTNDLDKLAVGGFLRGAMLNPKGRVLAVVDIVREEDALLVLSEPRTGDKVHTILEKHAIADDVVFTRVEQLACHRVWTSPADVWTAPPIFAESSGSPADLVEVRRIEAGLPRYGVDVSEDYFPFEANLDAAISYTKGCYIGQEVVARAHARGHANKRLVGIKLDSLVAPGTTLGAETRLDAGIVTSSAISPDFGPIALAYVHKSAWEPGTKVSLGVVSALPFTG